MVNKKYSFNGYDPQSPAIINQKNQLKALFNQRVLNRKQYSAAIAHMKKGWKNVDLSREPVGDFNDSEIVGSDFSQDEPYSNSLPDITGVTFIRCNLDGIEIPSGNTLVMCSNKQHKEQNDRERWVVDRSLKPESPLNSAVFDELNVSKKVGDIPKERQVESVLLTKYKKEKENDKESKLIGIAGDPVKRKEFIKNGGVL